MKHKITFALLCFAAVVFFTACKPSVGGENDTWADNQKKAADYTTKFPAFGAAIAEEGANAQKIWDDAAKITKEEDKAAKMREANTTYGKILDPLWRYNLYSESAEKDQAKASNLKYASSVYDRVSSDMSDAGSSLAKANDMIASAKPAGLDDAIKIATDAADMASSADSKFNSCIRKAKK